MVRIPSRRAIVDRAALNAAVAAALAGAPSPSACRGALLALFKDALRRGEAEIRRRFEAGAARGEETVRARSFLLDQTIRAVYDLAADRVYPAANPTAAERICLAAVGGYGRGELAPHSDVDLLFLLPWKLGPRAEQVIEYVLYMLWDLGLKVGQAARPVEECLRRARTDQTICTAILEARYVWGERALFDELRARFRDQAAAGSERGFVEAKLAERDRRHRRMGDSRYVLEPNVKDGKGGLRDLHTLFWIARFLFRAGDSAELVRRGVLTAGEAARFDKAQRFLWTVRCHLHYLAGRGEDRLTFDLQAGIGARLGYRDRAGARGVERFMKHYYLTAKGVGDLTGIFCAALEVEHARRPRFALPRLGFPRKAPDGFVVEAGRLALAKGRKFRDRPLDLVRLFHAAQDGELDVHPRPLRAVTRNLRLVDGLRGDPEANRLFLEMLASPKDPETALRRLNEAGVFGRFIPDFGRIVAQMQHDMYHVYTVDEHSIRAVGVLRGIEAGDFAEEMPVATRVAPTVQSRRALLMAVLLHDIAKGRGGDHSTIGAGVAERLCPRLGLTAEETETVSWLVRHHLAMSNTAFRRDLSDPQTIAGFVETVRSPERLKLLLLLTAADIRAVGPGVWTAWKAALLRDLYRAAEEVLTGGLAAEDGEARIARARGALRAALADWPEAEVEAQLERGAPGWWLSCPPDAHLRHARLMRRAREEGAKLLVDCRVDRYRGVTEIVVHTADHPGLFAQIAGALAVSGANIVDARIFTMTDGAALDTFWVEDAAGGPIERPDRLDRISATIARMLAGEAAPRRALAGLRSRAQAGRGRVFDAAPRVIVDNAASRTHTVIEVNGRDRPGLLYALTRALAGQNVQVASARIATYGESAADVFYVKDVFGLKIDKEARLRQIRAALLEALAPAPAPQPAGAPARLRLAAAS